MGAVQGFDRLLNSVAARSALASTSFQQPLMCSFILMLAGNAAAMWRLGKREHDLDAEHWPGLSSYIRNLRGAGQFDDFVVDCAIDMLAHGGSPLVWTTGCAGAGAGAGSGGAADEVGDEFVAGDDTELLARDARPSGCASIPAATADEGGEAGGMTDADMAVLKAQLHGVKQHKARRAFFRSDIGRRFRSYNSVRFKHSMERVSRGFCAVCSRTENLEEGADGREVGSTCTDANPRPRKRVRRVGYKATRACTLCGVRLCTVSARHERKCFAQWHDASFAV